MDTQIGIQEIFEDDVDSDWTANFPPTPFEDQMKKKII